MARCRKRCLASLAAFAIASCNAPHDKTKLTDADVARNGASAPDSRPGEGSAFMSPTTRAPGSASSLGSAGLLLPDAALAPSALFNAAYQRVENNWEQILYLCDGVDDDRVKLITMPNAKGLSALWSYRKSDFRTDVEAMRLGDEESGAGQIMRAIQRPNGSGFGSVHSVNPGMLGGSEGTRLPTLSSITAKGATTRCRWEPRARVLLFDGRRSILVIAAKGGSYTYKSFDYGRPGKVIDAEGGATSAPTIVVTGGRLVPSEPNHETYEFPNGTWIYRVSASADNRVPGAKLTVLRNGKSAQVSVAAAYQMAARRIE